jgi:hypothetical protein
MAVINEDIYSGPLPVAMLTSKNDTLIDFTGDNELFDDQTLPEKLQNLNGSIISRNKKML